jgi:hypothetical protein
VRPASWRHALPLLAGPLALVAFFLPWTSGPGILAIETYSGFDLVRVTGVLQSLELPAAEGATLVAVRVLLLAIPVAATWVTILAPAHRWHWAYPAAAAYLVAITPAILLARLLITGDVLPSPGLALLVLASMLLVMAHMPAPASAVEALAPRLPRLQQSHRRTPAR